MSTDLHAELLHHLDRIDEDAMGFSAVPTLTAALRAVVELHAPVREGRVFAYYTCSGCDNGSYAIDSPDWPCSTVQAVAAALGLTVPDGQKLIEKEERRG